jgi:hypothetical protein
MSHSLSPGLDGPLTLVPASDVDATDEIIHFDQLTDRAKRVVIAATEGRSVSVHAPSLESVDVVVFTDYYRVE